MQFVFVSFGVCVCTRACVGKGGGEKGDMLCYICCLLLFMGGAHTDFLSGIKNFWT